MISNQRSSLIREELLNQESDLTLFKVQTENSNNQNNKKTNYNVPLSLLQGSKINNMQFEKELQPWTTKTNLNRPHVSIESKKTKK